MKIRIFSDIHVDINQHFPFSFKDSEKDVFTLVAGDVSGNVKLTSRWIGQNIRNGMFIVGNHDPCYNDLGWTIEKQKEFLHGKFPLEANVTFLDEQVGVMSKLIPETNILVVGSTLYTDYKYADDGLVAFLEHGNERRKMNGESELTVEQVNMVMAERGLNDFRWGHVKDENDEMGLKQRYVRPSDYRNWFDITFKKISELVEANSDRDIIVMTHHCPSIRCISSQYVGNSMNASYVSDLEGFILSHPNIKAWCCGHVHSVANEKIGSNGQWIVCNPRGYEKNMENENWSPNTFLDTDTWEVKVEPYSNPKLEKTRKKFHDDFMKYAPLFF